MKLGETTIKLTGFGDSSLTLVVIGWSLVGCMDVDGTSVDEGECSVTGDKVW